MKKTFKSNEIVTNPAAIKGGGNGGLTVIVVERKAGPITDNINGRTKGVVEDNVMI